MNILKKQFNDWTVNSFEGKHIINKLIITNEHDIALNVIFNLMIDEIEQKLMIIEECPIEINHSLDEINNSNICTTIHRKHNHVNVTRCTEITNMFSSFHNKVNKIITSIKIKSTTSTEIIVNLLEQKVNENKNNYFFYKVFSEQITLLETPPKKRRFPPDSFVLAMGEQIRFRSPSLHDEIRNNVNCLFLPDHRVFFNEKKINASN